MQRDPTNRNVEQERPPGTIDTIGTAFSLLSQRPYLIWPPILLDLFLWLGFRLSAQPMVVRMEQWLAPQVAPGDDMLRLLSEFRESNLFVLLAILMPSLLSELGRGAFADAGTAGTSIQLSWWLLPALSVVIALVGAVFGVAYLTMVGYLVRAQPVGWSLAQDAARNALRALGFVAVALGAFLLVAMPLLVFSGAVLVLGVNITALVSMLLVVGAIWYLLMLFFALHAIVISGAGPFRAMYLSYNVVRANFWPTLGFIAIFLAIRHGVPLALHLFTSSPWSVPFALIANAYVATGVTAAAMLFYRDRARALVVHLTTSSNAR